MRLAIEISDDVDPTALATVALAVLTLIALLYTRRALNQTRNEIAISGQQVEEAHRPVLVPVLDQTRQISVAGDTRYPAAPLVPGNRILVPVENIGSRPALGVEATLRLRGETIPDAHGIDLQITNAGIGINSLVSLEFPLAGAALGPFDLRLRYRDVVGKAWVTTGRYAIGLSNRYEDLSVAPE